MNNEIIFYSTPDGDKKVEVLFQDENFWLTQKALAGLFDVKVPAISKHLKNIFESGELVADSVISILETVRQEGSRSVKRNLKYYNLDSIIAVGYRVNSYQATQFRIWATKTLKEFIIKGFVLDDERQTSSNKPPSTGLNLWAGRPLRVPTSAPTIWKSLISEFGQPEKGKGCSYAQRPGNYPTSFLQKKPSDWLGGGRGGSYAGLAWPGLG